MQVQFLCVEDSKARRGNAGRHWSRRITGARHSHPDGFQSSSLPALDARIRCNAVLAVEEVVVGLKDPLDRSQSGYRKANAAECKNRDGCVKAVALKGGAVRPPRIKWRPQGLRDVVTLPP